VLRHIVLLELDEATTDEQIAALVERLQGLADRVEDVDAVEVGVDAGLAPGNHRLALVLDCPDAEAWRRYQVHPAHVEVVSERIKPLLVSRAAIQFERRPT